MILHKFSLLKYTFSVAFFALAFSFNALAQHEETHATEATEHVAEGHDAGPEKFDAGKMIIEHISDAHDWHIMDVGGHPVSIPLPVILYSNKGLDLFMSSKFEHGHAVHNGFKLEKQNIVAVNEAGEVDAEATNSIIDLSITKNVATLMFSVACLLWIFLSIAGAYKKNPNKAPSGLQSFMEPLILFIRDEVAKPSIGPKYEKFVPYLLTVFFLILFNNLLGLVPIIPGGANLTGNIAFTMVLAVITFVITSINGTKHYWHHIFAMPGVPKAVLLILTPIEILGVFLRPFVLMIRLFANMTAGHIIALSFFALIFIFGQMSAGAGFGVSIVSVAFTVFMGCLELLVAFLQAYVFVLLSAMYFGSAVEEPHHEAHH
ncbi:MAG: F0F1 ATP synthase subunit A [Bacteroidota bacterium]